MLTERRKDCLSAQSAGTPERGPVVATRFIRAQLRVAVESFFYARAAYVRSGDFGTYRVAQERLARVQALTLLVEQAEQAERCLSGHPTGAA